MKKSLQFALPLLIPAVLLLGSPAFSQGNGNRGGNRGGGNGPARQERGNSGGQGRSMGQERNMGNPNRTFERGNQGQGRSMGSPNRSFDPTSRDRSGYSQNRGTYGQRHVYEADRSSPVLGSSPDGSGNVMRSPDQRDRFYNGSRPASNYGRNDGRYDNRNSGYNGGYSSRGRTPSPSYRGYPSGRYNSPVRWGYHYPYRGQTFTSLSYGYRTIPWGGYNYCYSGGVWYRPYGSIFRVVAPPIGISINILPFGYTRLWVGPDPYYYYSGVYYTPRNNGYVVVDPPLGAKLPALPYGARETFINGQRLFEDDGTYYMEEFNVNGQRLYTVVGVHGVLDQSQIDIISGTGYTSSYDPGLLSVLPANSRTVVISGQEYYVTPEDIYYQQITDGNSVSYQVVGR